MSLISVVLTTFNGASRGYIDEAVRSVLDQTDSAFELIILDDGSRDDTPAVCQGYSDSRIHYLRKENGGPASARNAGIRAARGDLICFLDDDDAWLPEKLARQRALFDSASPKPGLVYSAIQAVSREGRPLYIQSHPASDGFYRRLFFENAVDATSSVMVSREALNKVGMFREEIFTGATQMCEDRDLWIRIAREFPVLSIDEPLVRYRVHENKLSSKHSQMEQSELLMLRLALEEAPAEIRTESAEIYRGVYRRFALDRFSLGDYAGFRKYFGEARNSGGAGQKLWLRYALSFTPPLVKLVRTLKRTLNGLFA